MGKSKEQTARRKKWVDLIWRKDFVATVIAEFVDYYPSTVSLWQRLVAHLNIFNKNLRFNLYLF